MKINSNRYQTLPFYLFVIGVFLIIVSPNLLSDGLFMDGLIYSTVAKNLSEGVGTFWHPHFTATCSPDFYGHPPLAFGIQSMFFSMFGESRYIDKTYSLLTYVLVGYIIIRIWKQLGYKHGWLPLLLWLSIPLVSWACTNNMLENTLAIFTSLSVLCYLKSLDNKKYLFLLLSGLMLSLGFLTKGFVAFFPWTFPLIMCFLLRRKYFWASVLDTIIIVIVSIIPILLLVFIFPEAKTSLNNYIDMQVVTSIKQMVTVDSRFYILLRLFLELIPAISIGILIILWCWRKKVLNRIKNTSANLGIVFVLLGLTGVLPIMISMKQSGFYILATFPFFAIGLAILLYPLAELLFDNIDYKSKIFLFFKRISLGIFLTGIILSVFLGCGIGRDKNTLTDTYIILPKLSKGSIINIDPAMWQDWSLHGYFGRYKNVSLDPYLQNKRQYLLIRNELYSDTLNRDYNIELQTSSFKLYKRK